MFKNATFLSFYFADNQLFSNSETLVPYKETIVILFKSYIARRSNELFR
jgi:hypothetical protein